MTDTAVTSQVFTQVLESLAMMFADQVENDELPQQGGECIAVSIEFVGPSSGALCLMASQQAAEEVAANVLGLDVGDPEVESSAHDALGELLNVTVGQLLTAIAGDEPVFDLTAPVVRGNVPRAEWQELLTKEGTVVVVADDHPLLLGFDLHESEDTEAGDAR